MKFKYYILLSIIIVTFSCESLINVVKYDDEIRPPTIANFGVFSSDKSIPYKFKEIGLITVDDQGWEKSEKILLDEAIVKAKEMGADGVLILSQDKQVDGYVPIGGTAVAVNRRIVRVAAIIRIGDKNDEESRSTTTGLQNQSIADELIKLKKLKDDGILTQEEFDTQKKKLLTQ